MGVTPSALGETEYTDRYQRLAPRGLRYAYSLLGNSADSEEVVQEAFCRLIRSDQTATKVNGAFPALLFTTIRNLCIDHRRTIGRRKQVSFDPEQHAAADKPDRDRAELEALVTRAIDGLPAPWADALRLRMDGELSYEQIASVLNSTHAQVRTWIYRARKQLADELKQQGFLADP